MMGRLPADPFVSQKEDKGRAFAEAGREMVHHPQCLLDVMAVRPRALPKVRGKDGQELDPRTSAAQKQSSQFAVS